MITDRQIDYIRDLQRSKQLTDDELFSLARVVDRDGLERINRTAASHLIDQLRIDSLEQLRARIAQLAVRGMPSCHQ